MTTQPDRIFEAKTQREAAALLSPAGQMKAITLLREIKSLIDGVGEDEIVMGVIFTIMKGKHRGELSQNELAAAGFGLGMKGFSIEAETLQAVWGLDNTLTALLAEVADRLTSPLAGGKRRLLGVSRSGPQTAALAAHSVAKGTRHVQSNPGHSRARGGEEHQGLAHRGHLLLPVPRKHRPLGPAGRPDR